METSNDDKQISSKPGDCNCEPGCCEPQKPKAITMLGIGFGVEKLSATTQKISTIVKYFAGILLIAIGFYLILTF